LGFPAVASEIEDFSNFIKLLNSAGNEIFPAEISTHFAAYASHRRGLKTAEYAAHTSAAIMTAVVLHSFSRRKNHFPKYGLDVIFDLHLAACEKNGLDFTEERAEQF